jgi:hypothetical protein
VRPTDPPETQAPQGGEPSPLAPHAWLTPTRGGRFTRGGFQAAPHAIAGKNEEAVEKWEAFQKAAERASQKQWPRVTPRLVTL